MTNCNSTKNTHPSFRSLLLLKICEAIYPKTDVRVAKRALSSQIKIDNLESFRCFSDRTLVKQVKKSTSVAVYRSAIALKLARQSPFTPLEIADHVAQSFQSFNLFHANTENQSLRKITVTVFDDGLLEFEFSDAAIAQWLQSVLKVRQTSCVNSAKTSKHNSRSLFLCQYSHARCCALIRLADASMVIGKTLEIDSSLWLGDDHNLLTKTASEQSLLAQIITTADQLDTATEPLKLAIDLSRAFQRFDRDCRILGAPQPDALQLSACRLGLVMITQRLLKQLLEVGLGVLAPESL